MHIGNHSNINNMGDSLSPLKIKYEGDLKSGILTIDTKKDANLIFEKFISEQHLDLKPIEKNVFQVNDPQEIQKIFKWAVESNCISPSDQLLVREMINSPPQNPVTHPLLKEKEKFLDPYNLLKGAADAEMKAENAAWTLAYALLSLNRENLTPQVQKELDFLILQAYSKATPSEQTAEIGMQVNPQAGSLTTYHRFGTDFLTKLNEKFRDDMGFSDKTEVFLIDSHLFKEVLNRSFASYVTIKDQAELETRIYKHLQDVLGGKAERSVVDISGLMGLDEEIFTKTAQTIIEKFNTEHKTSYTLYEAELLCPVAFSEHKGEKVLLLPAAKKIDIRYLTNLLHTTGFYLSPDKSKKALLKIDSLSSAIPQKGELATAGSTIPIVFANVKEFAANRILKQFGELSSDPTASLSVKLQAKATAKLIAGLADLNIDQACEEKNLTPLLQIAYFTLKNSMQMAMLNKHDFVAFNSEIELMHQVLQSIVEVTQPYDPSALAIATCSGLRNSQILPKNLNDPKVHLKASAMHCLSSVLSSVEQQKGTNKLNVANIQGSYYEVGGALSKSGGGFHYEKSILDEDLFDKDKERAFKDLKNMPLDVFVCEFHHNFQDRKEEYSPVKVLEQVIEVLKRNSGHPITIVVDNTIGLERSDELRDLLADATLQEAIGNGKLNLVLLRSAQKFDMLGQDNYYGGITTTFNNPNAFKLFNTRMDDPADQLEGFNYQGLTHIHTCAQTEVDEYRKALMNNTHKLYNSLLSKGVKVSKALEDERGVVKIAEINDESTPFLHIEGMKKSDFIEFANANGLPLTDRLSFGFANSNVTEIYSAVRFTVGLEEEAILEKYAQFIADAQKKSLEPLPPSNFGRFNSEESYEDSYSGDEYEGGYSEYGGSASRKDEGSVSESEESRPDSSSSSDKTKSTKNTISTGSDSGE